MSDEDKSRHGSLGAPDGRPYRHHHRAPLSTIRDAHKIVVLKGGYVAEEGTHAELIARDGIYAELYKSQAGSTPAPK